MVQDAGSPSATTLNEVSRAVADMVESVAERGSTLDDAAAVSLVVSVRGLGRLAAIAAGVAA